MKVQIWNGFAVDFGKDLAVDAAHAENVGIVRFGPSGGSRLAACLDELIAAGHTNAWAPMAFRAFAREWPLRAVLADGIPWVEIDFPEDLDFASHVLAPYLAAVRSRRRL
jgi:choline kinase